MTPFDAYLLSMTALLIVAGTVTFIIFHQKKGK